MNVDTEDNARQDPAADVSRPGSVPGWRAFLGGLRPRFLGTAPLDLRIAILAFPVWSGTMIALILWPGVRFAGWDRLLMAGTYMVTTFLGFLFGRTWAMVMALIPMLLFLLAALWGLFVGSASFLSVWGLVTLLTAAGAFVLSLIHI